VDGFALMLSDRNQPPTSRTHTQIYQHKQTLPEVFKFLSALASVPASLLKLPMICTCKQTSHKQRHNGVVNTEARGYLTGRISVRVTHTGVCSGELNRAHHNTNQQRSYSTVVRRWLYSSYTNSTFTTPLVGTHLGRIELRVDFEVLIKHQHVIGVLRDHQDLSVLRHIPHQADETVR
jgi:hypothetical protein